MIMMKHIKFSGLLVAVTLSTAVAFGQIDTTKKQTIDITSSYKPLLRNAVKINFSATNLLADTNKIVAPYKIPAQNLFYSYQPISLKPLALAMDSVLDLGIRNYLKLGFGNYTTPLVSAGVSFGDGKKYLLNVYADYISSKGGIQFQDYSQVNIKTAGSYFTEKNELYGSAAFNQREYFMYGYDHLIHNYNKSDLLQRFQNIKINTGFRNKTINGTGINYNPNIEINIFSNQNKLTENSLLVTVPLEKTFGEAFTIKAAVKADISSYSTKNLLPNVKFNNNIYSIIPELVYAKPLFNIHAGFTPTWDNGKLTVFPNIYGEMKIKDQVFLIQAGFIGRFIKNNFQNLSGINPYLQTVSYQQNTKETEIYGGLKATLGKHFNFSAKASFITFNNLPFFINDTLDGKSFYISNDSRVNDIRIHGDLSFISTEKFTITSGLTFNGYTGMQNNARAWGTIPLELNASLRWKLLKQLLIKSDVMTFSGAAFLLKNNFEQKLAGGADLSVGAEWQINKRFTAWADANNLLNNKYQRWYAYPVYGLNVLAGVIIKF